MTDREGERLPTGVLLAFAVVGDGALVIAVLGGLSLFTASDTVETPGISIVAGVFAVLVSLCAFAAALWPVLRRPRPAFTAVILVMLVSALAYLLGLWALAVLFGSEAIDATAAVGHAVTGWPAAAIAMCAGVCAWLAIATRRTRAHPPRWPWEREER